MLRQRTCERRVARARRENAPAGQISGQVTDLAVTLTGPRAGVFPRRRAVRRAACFWP